MRSLICLLIGVVVVSCEPAPPAATATGTPSVRYPSLTQVVRAVVQGHVDSPSSRTVLEPATRAIIADIRRSSFTLSGIDVPAYTGDTDTDIGLAVALLNDIRRQLPSMDASDLEERAIGAVVAALHDCESNYVSRQSPTLAASGFAGIGGELQDPSADTGGLPWIRIVFPGSPAERAGVRDGDRIRSLNGRSVAGLSARETAALVRGPEGSALDIAVSGPSGDRSFTITRAVVQTAPIVERIIDGRIGYVTPLSALNDTPTSEIRSVIDRWNDAGVSGWILDLRDQQVTSVAKGRQIASAFIETGPLWLQTSRATTTETVADGGAARVQRPLAVLIDAKTDEMALAIASALKERARARLFGEAASGCTEYGPPYPLVSGGVLYLAEYRILALGARQPLRTLGVDETVRRSADGSDVPLAAAVAWLRRQAP